MNTRSKAVAPNTIADVPTNVSAPHTSADPTRDETPPPWARVLMENMQTLTINVQANSASLQSLHKNLISMRLGFRK